MLLIRSLIFHVLLVMSLLAYLPLILLCFSLPYRVRYWVITRWGVCMVAMAKILCGIHYQIEGRENIIKGPAIVMGKHQSTWETLIFQIIFPPQVWVLKRELMYIPFFGWGLALMEPVAIDRNAGRKAIEQIIKQGCDRLARGRWVVIFPEGTRVPPGKRRRYGLGGAVLAAASGYPVIPVAHNAGTYWPRRSLRLFPGTIRVVIGPPIETQGREAEDIRQQVEQWIETKMMELEGRSEPAELIRGRHHGK